MKKKSNKKSNQELMKKAARRRREDKEKLFAASNAYNYHPPPPPPRATSVKRPFVVLAEDLQGNEIEETFLAKKDALSHFLWAQMKGSKKIELYQVDGDPARLLKSLWENPVTGECEWGGEDINQTT